MVKTKNALLLALTFTLAACSSTESQIKEYMLCGMAAHQLGEQRAAMQIGKAMGEYGQEKNFSGNARSAMMMGQEIRDDLDLYNASTQKKYFTFLKIYNSSSCQDMHDQGKLSAPWMYYLLYFLV